MRSVCVPPAMMMLISISSCFFKDMGTLFNKRLKNLNKNLVPNKMYHYLMHIFIFPYPSSSLFLSLVLPQSESLAASIIFC